MQRRNLIFLAALLILSFTVFHLHSSSNIIIDDHHITSANEIEYPPVDVQPSPSPSTPAIKDEQPIISTTSVIVDRPDPINNNNNDNKNTASPPPISVLPENESTETVKGEDKEEELSACDNVNFNWL